jgi:AP-4 complex subunit epsilon-1
LLETAAEAISRFIQSRSHNLKYLGVTGLALIVESHPQYAAQHQLAVMDCLEDPDETLQRKTLDLLYRMTNPVNVEFIAEKLVDFLSKTTDLFLKKVLTSRVCSIAERYAPNNAWYIRTITKLFEVAGDMVSMSVAQNLMSLIAEGTGESDEADMLLRQNAVEIYVGLLHDKPVGSLPRILLETMAWCLGEYGYLSSVNSLDQVLTQLCQLARIHKAKLSPVTRKFLLSAIMKLVAQAGTCPPHAAAVIDDYTKSKDVDLQQRCLEFQNMLTNCPNLLPEILPVDASAEDVDVDPDLSFLNGFVAEALHNGARPYEKPEDDDDDDDYLASTQAAGQTAFKMTPYDKPQAPAQARMAMSGMGSGSRSSQAAGSLPPGSGAYGGSGASVSAAPAPGGELSLNTRNVANVWGRSGVTEAPPPEPAAPAHSQHQHHAHTPAPASGNSWDNHGAASSSQNAYGGSSSAYGGSSGYGAPAPAPEPVKTAQQLERERQASYLFGGMDPSAPPPPPTQASAPVSAPPPPKAAPAPPPPAPAPEVDLLDMSMWDAPAPAPASAAPPVQDFDALSMAPAAAPAPAAAAPPPPAVETVEDDDDEGDNYDEAPVGEVDDDPFAGAGLLSDVYDKPLPTMASSTKFEYNGSVLAPFQISTAQFGQQWGSCPASSALSVNSTKINSLDKFMEVCASAGFYKVEAIGSTNEGICAGTIDGGSHVALIHGKVSPLGAGGTKIDATVKSTEQSMGGSLAMYLQTMLR